MSRTQYLFFDLGWTLEDETAAQIDRAAKAVAAARQFGLAITVEDILALQEVGAAQQVPEVFRYALLHSGLDEGQAEIVATQAVWDKRHLSLYPDAPAVLAELSQRHFLGLIANQSAGTEPRLEAYGIRQFFSLIFASAELGLAKPDPEIFRLAQEQAGCLAEQAWMIGDRLDNDIAPANATGWHTVRALQGYNARQEPHDPSQVPDHTVRQLRELLDIVP